MLKVKLSVNKTNKKLAFQRLNDPGCKFNKLVGGNSA
jgi:hypothetical protein